MNDESEPFDSVPRELVTECERRDGVHLVALDAHAWYLCDLLRGFDSVLPGDRWYRTSDWLRMASGLEDVEVDTTKFDMAAMFCSLAVPYELALRRDTSAWALDLTRFLFCWNALESATAAVIPPIRVRRGLVSAATAYLLAHPVDPLPTHYDCTLRNVVFVASRYAEFRELGQVAALEPALTAGVRTAARFRNTYVHGGLEIPAPEGWGGGVSPSRAIIRYASRLALFGVQLIFASALDPDVVAERLDDLDFEPPGGPPVLAFHLSA